MLAKAVTERKRSGGGEPCGYGMNSVIVAEGCKKRLLYEGWDGDCGYGEEEKE